MLDCRVQKLYTSQMSRIYSFEPTNWLRTLLAFTTRELMDPISEVLS